MNSGQHLPGEVAACRQVKVSSAKIGEIITESIAIKPKILIYQNYYYLFELCFSFIRLWNQSESKGGESSF